MKSIDVDATVDIVFQIRWKSDAAAHTECFHAGRVNMWRDILPQQVASGLLGKETGDQVIERLGASDLLTAAALQKPLRIRDRQFDGRISSHGRIVPRKGRFYPKGLLRQVPGIFPGNNEPFRLVAMENGYMEVDLGHPLAGRELLLSAVVGKVEEKGEERGGTSVDWMETVATGPGMQARRQGVPTDYFSGTPFARDDESEDSLFYSVPRFTHHLDDTARGVVEELYGRHLADGMEVLDLMASWHSHVFFGPSLKGLTGLGLNGPELDRNPLLTEVIIHDLNREPALPFPSRRFDAVICTVSVEYLIDPLAVFREVGRVLVPGGIFIVTFSNRWFPPKVIRIWKELHEFERMGLVSEFFLRSGAFSKIQTWSMRGLPRPRGDKYFHEYPQSDPVYAVWGQKT